MEEIGLPKNSPTKYLVCMLLLFVNFSGSSANPTKNVAISTESHSIELVELNDGEVSDIGLTELGIDMANLFTVSVVKNQPVELTEQIDFNDKAGYLSYYCMTKKWEVCLTTVKVTDPLGSELFLQPKTEPGNSTRYKLHYFLKGQYTFTFSNYEDKEKHVSIALECHSCSLASQSLAKTNLFMTKQNVQEKIERLEQLMRKLGGLTELMQLTKNTMSQSFNNASKAESRIYFMAVFELLALVLVAFFQIHFIRRELLKRRII